MWWMTDLDGDLVNLETAGAICIEPSVESHELVVYAGNMRYAVAHGARDVLSKVKDEIYRFSMDRCADRIDLRDVARRLSIPVTGRKANAEHVKPTSP